MKWFLGSLIALVSCVAIVAFCIYENRPLVAIPWAFDAGMAWIFVNMTYLDLRRNDS